MSEATLARRAQWEREGDHCRKAHVLSPMERDFEQVRVIREYLRAVHRQKVDACPLMHETATHLPSPLPPVAAV